MFESAGWSLSSSLHRCFKNAEEFHVRLDKGMEQSGDSLYGHHDAAMRSWRMPRTRSVV